MEQGNPERSGGNVGVTCLCVFADVGHDGVVYCAPSIHAASNIFVRMGGVARGRTAYLAIGGVTNAVDTPNFMPDESVRTNILFTNTMST